MAHATITVYPKGIECEVLVEGHVEHVPYRFGMDEFPGTYVEDITFTRVDGSALPRRVKALIEKEYEDYAADTLAEAEW